MEILEKEYLEFVNNNEVSEATLIKYKENKENIIIPYGIKKLSSSAFRNNFKVKKLSMPYVKSIEDGEIVEAMTIEEMDDFVGCFSGCINLNQVFLPKELTRLPACIFSKCRELEKVTFMSSVTEIDKMAFYGCTNLQDINLPSSLEIIKMYAFYNCISLKTLFIPKSVKYIGKYAFSGMTSMQTIIFECDENQAVNFHPAWNVGSECKFIWNYSLRK